jgi:hypothetical protein
MSVKGWTALARIVFVASLSTSGSSLIPMHSQLPLRLDIGTVTRISDGSVVFRSALRDAPTDSAVILAEWTRSNTAESGSDELSKDQDTTSLPEPGSGFLLALGFLAAFPLAGRIQIALANRRSSNTCVY